ncbi:hypothetical protein PQX77_003629 [Marasmius sp. AFHP31]|nr:hypothetical protein PQX77_003629 [Marasmius sp. AFHP31]
MSDDDMSEIDDTATLCSDVSDAQTAVEPNLQPALDVLPYRATLHEPYLTQIRHNNFFALKQRHPGARIVLPPPFSIEFSFNEFISALARSYLVAKLTPPSRSLPGSSHEFQDMSRLLKITLDTSVPTTQHESNGNALEIKRMLFKSVILWASIWDQLPAGTNKRLLYKFVPKDIAKFIEQKAKTRSEEDKITQSAGGNIIAYRNMDWRVIMEQDLADSKWQGWRKGLIQQ